MSTPRRSLPQTKKTSTHSLPGHALSEGQPQRHSFTKTYSRNSSTKYMSGSPGRSQKTTNSKSIRLSDLMAAMYPGMKIGHKNCVEKVLFVPKTMGWLWNTEDTATGVPFPRGWRPGAIALGVRRNVRSRLMSEPLTTPTGSKGKKKKKTGRSNAPSSTKKSKSGVSSIAIDVPPTLCIQKEHGVYHVKMRPIKKGGEDEIIEEEQPVQFKIADSASSYSQLSKSSSSSLKIEYLCTGALRKPIKKPEKAEMGTQWENFEKEEEKGANEEKKSRKKGKKEIETKVGTIIKGVGSKVGTIIKGVEQEIGAMEEKIGPIKGKKEIEAKVGRIIKGVEQDIDIGAIEEKIGPVKGKKEIEVKVGRIIKGVEQDRGAIEEKIGPIKGKKEIEAKVGRTIKGVEQDIGAIEEKIGPIKGKKEIEVKAGRIIKGVEQDRGAIEEKIGPIKGKKEIEAVLEAIDEKIGPMTGKTETLKLAGKRPITTEPIKLADNVTLRVY